MAEVRVGIVGLGRMGRVRLDAMRDHPVLRPVAGCDVDPNGAANPIPLPIVGNYRDLLEMPVDAVFVCTPNDATAAVVVEALDAGKHVFSEKPPGRTRQEARAMWEAQHRHPTLVLKFGFNHRYHVAVREAKAIVDSGRLGRVLWVRGVYGKSGGARYLEDWRSRRAIAGGGILLDQGIHMLDLFRHFCGEFDEVHSQVDRVYWDTNVEDNVFALLRSRAGPPAMLHSSATMWKHTFQLDLGCSEGYVTITGIVSGTRSYGRETLIVGRRQFEGETFALGNPREEIVYFDRDPSWQAEVEEFATCITTGAPVAHGTPDDALRVMDLVYRIYEADPRWQEMLG